MVKIKSVEVSINENSEYDGEVGFRLSASVKSDSREFLERVSKAIHKELANPEPAESVTSDKRSYS